MKTFRHFFVAQLVLLIGLSAISGFKIPNFKDANWDTVLFLTPIGILKNFTADNPVLRSFYLDISAGQTEFAPWQWAAVSVVYLVSALAGIFYLRRSVRDA